MIKKVLNLFTKEEAGKILEYYDQIVNEEIHEYVKSTIADGSGGDMYDPSTRDSEIKWLADDVQFAKYTVGCHLNWHNDVAFQYHDKRERYHTIIILLNDDFEGGEFEIIYKPFGVHPKEFTDKTNEQCINTNLKAGDCIVIPSGMYHRVKQVTKGTRFSITMWNTSKRHINKEK